MSRMIAIFRHIQPLMLMHLETCTHRMFILFFILFISKFLYYTLQFIYTFNISGKILELNDDTKIKNGCPQTAQYVINRKLYEKYLGLPSYIT